jgi:hypothetical protein
MKNTEQKMINNIWGLKSLKAASLFSCKTFSNNDESLKLQFLLEQRYLQNKNKTKSFEICLFRL